MLYCPPNVTLSDVWIKHGISHCFMDTVGPAVWGGFLLLFGTIQLLIYRKYATPTDPTQISKSRLYALQMFLLLFMPILALLRFLLNSRIYTDSAVYGYMVSNVNGANKSYKHIFINCFVADILHMYGVFLLSLLHLPYKKGALLSAAFSTNSWTRFDSIALLDFDVDQ